MNIFIAGATGTLGMPLVRALVARGHNVAGLTRTADKQHLIERAGATPVVADALDEAALTRAVCSAAPDCVVHALTALPKRGPMRAADLNATNELRTTGTANLLRAAVTAGTRRFVGESMIFAFGFGDHGTKPLSEDYELEIHRSYGRMQATVDAVRSLERQLLAADCEEILDAVVLRYGLFYGGGSPATRYMLRMVERRMMPTVSGTECVISWVHVVDAVEATVAAIERGRSGTMYNIVDDEPVSLNEWIRRAASAAGAPDPWTMPRWLLRLFVPYVASIYSTRLPVDNSRSRRELAWTPAYPTTRDGLREATASLAQEGASQ